MNQKILELRKEEVSLKKKKNSADDPKFIENVAREELKMVKPNEIIYIDINKSKYKQ